MNKNTLTYTIIALLLLIGLFAFIKPKASQAPTRSTGPQATTQVVSQSASDSAQTNGTTAVLVLKNKQLISGPETIQVHQGDQVVIKVLSDMPEEFHLHGYEKIAELEKDKPTTISFAATTTGRFEYELEKSGTALGALEVLPK